MKDGTLIEAGTRFLARQGTGEFPHVTEFEIKELVARAPGEQTRLMLKTLWHTGARISEILDITLKGLDVERKTLIIRRRKRRKVFEQEMPIPGDLANELRLFARAKRRRGKLFAANRVSAFRTILALGRKILGREISPHHIRHGRAYHLVKEKNAHPLLVARALGHASLTSSLAYYHPTNEDLRRILES